MFNVQKVIFQALTAVVTLVVAAPLLATNVHAATSTPSYPVCANPQGEVVAKYNNGNHGIVGQGEKSGSDVVYKLSGDTLTQCFCGSDGNGIQTNWWKVSGLSDEDIKNLVNSGWQMVFDGSAWGLDSGPYLAINGNYTCAGTSNGSSTNSSGGQSTGDILQTGVVAASVLSLADTGNLQTIVLLGSLGALLVASGLVVRKLKG